jgi:hypothetical protein
MFPAGTLNFFCRLAFVAAIAAIQPSKEMKNA